MEKYLNSNPFLRKPSRCEAGSPFAAPVKTIRTPGFLHLLRVLRATHMVSIAWIRLNPTSATGARKGMEAVILLGF
jgi:hypothetical protein